LEEVGHNSMHLWKADIKISLGVLINLPQSGFASYIVFFLESDLFSVCWSLTLWLETNF